MLFHGPTGKLPGQPLAATNVAGLIYSRLLHITDRNSGLTYLIDTGAAVSVIPPSREDRRLSTDHLNLRAANGTPIPTNWDEISHPQPRTQTNLPVVIADVHKPILGADFLYILASWLTYSRADWLTPTLTCKFKASWPRPLTSPHLFPPCRSIYCQQHL